MKDVIEMLLNKQATLEAEKEAEKALAIEKIDADYAERSDKISALLEMAGYVPAVEEAAEVDTVDVEAAEAEEAEVCESTPAEANEQIVY